MRHAFPSRRSQLPTVNFPNLRYTSLLMNSITALDNLWMDGRVPLLRPSGIGRPPRVIDPGPGSTLDTLRQQLQAAASAWAISTPFF